MTATGYLVSARVEGIKRRTNSVNGNPRWAVTLIHETFPTKYTTANDATLGYEITFSLDGSEVDALVDSRGTLHDIARWDTICGACGKGWSERLRPTPSARCPFEYDHEED